MPVNEFLQRFGFAEDPFESTNAENEELLSEYFVTPPYFTSVMGDPRHPKSHIVFAPRGAGKTAQRRMIEDQSVESRDILCITYDHFEQPPGFALDSVDLAYHLSHLCRLLVVAVLAELEEDRFQADSLTTPQRELVRITAQRFLGDLSAEQFKQAISAVKSLGQKASQVWHKYGGVIALAINAALTKLGANSVGPAIPPGSVARTDDSLTYLFGELVGIVQSLGFSSTYFLVDRVDEIPLTSTNADATFRLIRPLLLDLPTLELSAAAFKFFLWDHIRGDFLEAGGRPDRIQSFNLSWQVSQLADMLQRRLRAYSGRRINFLNELRARDCNVDIDRLVCYLAQGSPRDMIRVAKAIVDEELKSGIPPESISANTVWEGISTFSRDRAQELCPSQYLDELRKVRRPSFTISAVASDVFHVKNESGRSKIQKWMAAGVVAQIGEVPNPGSRPMHLYGIVDLRVAIAVAPPADTELVLGNYVSICPECQEIAISAEQDINCRLCGRMVPLADATSLLDAVIE